MPSLSNPCYSGGSNLVDALGFWSEPGLGFRDSFVRTRLSKFKVCAHCCLSARVLFEELGSREEIPKVLDIYAGRIDFASQPPQLG